MINPQAKDLFQLQTELIEMKVDMAVNKTLDRAITQLSDLIAGVREEVHGLRGEMNTRFSSVEQRLIAVETKLGIKNAFHTEIRSKTLDYSFKAGWLALGGVIMYGMVLLHTFLVR